MFVDIYFVDCFRDDAASEKVPWSIHDHDHSIFGGVDDVSITARDAHVKREQDSSGKDQQADEDALVEAVATGGASASYPSYRTRDPFHVRAIYRMCLVSYSRWQKVD